MTRFAGRLFQAWEGTNKAHPGTASARQAELVSEPAGGGRSSFPAGLETGAPGAVPGYARTNKATYSYLANSPLVDRITFTNGSTMRMVSYFP